MHLAVAEGADAGRPASAADRRDRAPDLQRQPDRLASPPGGADGGGGVHRRSAREHGIAPVAIHASYLINLAGDHRAVRAANRSRGCATRCSARRATGRASSTRTSARIAAAAARRGWQRIARVVRDVLGDTPPERAARRSRTRPAAATRSARGSRSWRRSSTRVGATGRPAGLLPRHGAPVGRRLRHLDRGGGRGGPGPVRRADRPRPAGADPPQRLEVGARLAQRPPRAHRCGADRAGGPGGVPARSAGCRGARPSSWRRPARSRATTRSTCAGAGCSTGGAETLPELPPQAMRLTRRSRRPAPSGARSERTVRRRG